MRRTPCATPVSSVSLKNAMSPVRATWVPPQNSFDSPIVTTRTVSPYFSPKKAMAPACLASAMAARPCRWRVLADARVDQVFDLLLLVVGERRGVRKVEAQAIGRHQRALLRHVRRRARGGAPSAAGASRSGCGGCRRAARRRRSARPCRRRAARRSRPRRSGPKAWRPAACSRAPRVAPSARRWSPRPPSDRPARRRTASRRRSPRRPLKMARRRRPLSPRRAAPRPSTRPRSSRSRGTSSPPTRSAICWNTAATATSPEPWNSLRRRCSSIALAKPASSSLNLLRSAMTRVRSSGKP